MAEVPNEAASLAVGKTSSPELLGYKRRKQLCGPHIGVVLGDESIGAVVCDGPLGERICTSHILSKSPFAQAKPRWARRREIHARI